MTKVIPFSRFRVIFPVISFGIIVIGLVVTFTTGGLNLGIDFQPGLNIRLQIAPVVARIAYTGEEQFLLNVRSGRLVVSTTSAEGADRYSYDLSEYGTVGELQAVLAEIPGLVFEPRDAAADPSSILSLEREITLGPDPRYLNAAPETAGLSVSIATVREALAEIGAPQIQTIGAEGANEFMIRIEEKAGATDYDTEIASRVRELLGREFGAGTVLIRQTDYVGARFSSNLGRQSAYLSVLAILLILAYTWFRFKLAYAVSAILALIHDAAFMFAFIGAFRIEFSTATIAAMLTIIGYSLNDTIVIFDRIRENSGILRSENFRTIVDTSVTQSLGRTLMTSLTTLLAVGAIYVFGTGSIRDFALALIIGVVIGTYSSMFVASPILHGWVTLAARRRKAKDAARYGVKTGPSSEAVASASPAGDAEADKTEVAEKKAAVTVIPKVERKLKGKRKRKSS